MAERTTRHGVFPRRVAAIAVTCTIATLCHDAALGRQLTPTLDVVPLHLSFSGKRDTGRLQAQPVQIRNSGGGELVWQARADVPWLSLSPARGLAPGTLLVGVEVRGLRPGTHSARVVIESAHAARSPQTVDVEVTVIETEPPGPPSLRAIPDRLACSALPGQTEAIALTLRIDAEENAQVAWTAETDQPWIETSPAHGVTPAVLRVSVLPSPLSIGEHAANVVIHPAGRGTALKVPVLLTVDAGQAGEGLAIEPTTLPPAPVNSPYAYALPVRGGRPPYTFQLAGSLPPDLALVRGVVLGIAKMPGTFQFGVIVSDGSNPPSTVTQTLTLDVVASRHAPALVVEPPRVSVEVAAGRAPAPATVSVSAGGATLRWAAVARAPWLRVVPASGTSPATFQVMVDTRRMQPGDYSAAIVITMEGAEGSPWRLPVQLRIK